LAKNRNGDHMKKVKRNLNTRLYLIVGVITFLIFSLGISLGVILDFSRLQYLEESSYFQQDDYKSLQLQYLYISGLDDTSKSCPILRIALEESIEDLSFSLEKVQEYEKGSAFNSAEYEKIKKTYTLDNLRYWLFSKRVKETCQDDIINILYFYSTDNCDVCPNQGTVLTYFKKKLKDELLVFPIDVDMWNKEKMVKILMTQYNVTKLPTLIIDDNSYEGIYSKEKISRLICEHSMNKERCLI